MFASAKSLFSILGAALCLRLFAEEPPPDRLIWDGKTYQIEGYVYPFEKVGAGGSFGLAGKSFSNSCARNVYVFAIEGGRLVCKKLLERTAGGEVEIGQKEIGGGIFCDWFSAKNIGLREMRSGGDRFFIGEKSYVLDVEKGAAQVRLVREMPELRMSYADKERRAGVVYDDVRDDWSGCFELGHFCLQPNRMEYSGFADLGVASDILRLKRVKTRGFVSSYFKSRRGTVYLKLNLPPTRTSGYCYASFVCADFFDFEGDAVEIEVENPLTLSQRVVAIRALTKGESVHNPRGKTYVPSFDANRAFLRGLKKLYPEVSSANIDARKLSAKMSAGYGGFSLAAKYCGGEGRRAYESVSVGVSDVSEFDYAFRYPDFDLKNAAFSVVFRFTSKDFSDIENWRFPKRVKLGGVDCWDFDKERNAAFRFATSPLAGIEKIAGEMGDLDALETLSFLLSSNAQATTSGAERLRVAAVRAGRVDFKKYPDYAAMLVEFGAGRAVAKIFAERLADFLGFDCGFNAAFVDSKDFDNPKKCREISIRLNSEISKARYKYKGK